MEVEKIYESLNAVSKGDFSSEHVTALVPLVAVAVAAVLLLNFLVLKIFSSGSAPLLNPDKYVDVIVSSKQQLTHNTYLFRLAFNHAKQPFGLPIGQHVTFRLSDGDGKDLLRSYTPVSDVDQLGYADFVIKVYPTGKMTQLLAKLSVGDTVSLRGPRGRFKYSTNMKKHLGMIAGGTGITPMFQVMSALFKNPADTTSVSLLFGNVTADDILLRTELEELTQQQPDRLSVYHVLNTPPADWTGGAGFITAEMIKERLPAPASDVLVLLCGPPAMLKAMNAHLTALGYTEDMIFMF